MSEEKGGDATVAIAAGCGALALLVVVLAAAGGYIFYARSAAVHSIPSSGLTASVTALDLEIHTDGTIVEGEEVLYDPSVGGWRRFDERVRETVDSFGSSAHVQVTARGGRGKALVEEVRRRIREGGLGSSMTTITVDE